MWRYIKTHLQTLSRWSLAPVSLAVGLCRHHVAPSIDERRSTVLVKGCVDINDRGGVSELIPSPLRLEISEEHVRTTVRRHASLDLHLIAKGVPENVLSRVHAPLGFAIGSQTVPEIAISIVAELIACRNLAPESP